MRQRHQNSNDGLRELAEAGLGDSGAQLDVTTVMEGSELVQLTAQDRLEHESVPARSEMKESALGESALTESALGESAHERSDAAKGTAEVKTSAMMISAGAVAEQRTELQEAMEAAHHEGGTGLQV